MSSILGYNIILANSEVIEEEEHFIYDFLSHLYQSVADL